ncbi:hypothetical protein ILUMI_04417 [Ignelater luminosus]|uniref:Uncharacterized protein n=1 Tax=Ignelater luminosus TaxID=2038154 RepID=A0A8K0DEI4_IGNLU|nr:hypothetical protein ILUMI_04417 [Ignelater luminosus]
MKIDTLENRIRTNIQTAAKKIYSRTNRQKSRLSKATIELLERRRNTDRDSAEYSDLNQTMRKKIRGDIRKHNTEIINAIIEHNCNMKILKRERLTGNTRIHQIKNKDGEIVREKPGISKVVEDLCTELYSTTILQPESLHWKISQMSDLKIFRADGDNCRSTQGEEDTSDEITNPKLIAMLRPRGVQRCPNPVKNKIRLSDHNTSIKDIVLTQFNTLVSLVARSGAVKIKLRTTLLSQITTRTATQSAAVRGNNASLLKCRRCPSYHSPEVRLSDCGKPGSLVAQINDLDTYSRNVRPAIRIQLQGENALVDSGPTCNFIQADADPQLIQLSDRQIRLVNLADQLQSHDRFY